MIKKIILLAFIISLGINNLAAQCTEDCVWPGDANANGIVNHLDLLTLGLTWNAEGPARNNPSVDWVAQTATDWADNLPVSGVNFKHSDADGNGQVSFPDWEAITNNFGQKNENFNGLLGNNFEGNDLRAIPSETNLSLGTTFEVDLQLGTADHPIEGIYGIGFTMSLTNEYAGVIDFDLSNSWLAEDGEGLLFLEKSPPDSNKVFIALTRSNQTPISGFGHLGTLSIVIVDIIDALQHDTTSSLPMDIRIENVYAINEMEEELIISGNSNTVKIKHASQLTAVSQTENTPKIKTFPNPVSDVLSIHMEQASATHIQLYNPKGQLVKQHTIETHASIYHLSVKDLNAGIYYLEIQTETGVVTQKVVIGT